MLRVAGFFHRAHGHVNFALHAAQRPKLAGAVMNDADGGRETQRYRAPADHWGILRMANAAADHRVDVDVKLGVLGQQAQLAVQHLQALLRNIVRHHVVDRNLQMVEARAVEPLDALRRQQVQDLN